MARARVDDEARGLVDDEQVLVLPHDGRRGRRRGLRGRLGRTQLDLLPALEPVALRTRDAVDERARLDGALGGRARADVVGEEAVEPRPGRLAAGPGASPRGDVERRRGGRGRRSAATSASRRIATPTTMKESARLKAGHR